MWLRPCIYERGWTYESFLSTKPNTTITSHTANGPMATEDVANVYVKELVEDITPYIINNTRPVLTVGY